MKIEYNNNTIYFAKCDESAVIPTKREEDGCYDLYACFPYDQMVIPPHKTVMIATGIKSAFSPKYRVALRERGSNIKNHIIIRAGQIDSGYRGEWFIGAYNDSDKPIIISKEFVVEPGAKLKPVETPDEILVPYKLAVCQFAIEEVPCVNIHEVYDVSVFESERGDGKLGSSGK